jgi:hypothetical protein
MTIFEHIKEHDLDCRCSYCSDVDPTKSISRELEKCVEELTMYSIKNLTDEQQNSIHVILEKVLLLRRYFPVQELPSKHQLLIDSLNE